MSRTIADLRLMLIQVRETRLVAEHEQACFLERCAVDPAAVKIHNVLDNPNISVDDVRDVDVVVIGGAAAHSATQDDAFTEALAEVIRFLVAESRPLFGSCWGHQFIARALGGELITDRANEEVGTFAIALTKAGHGDALFSGFPSTFMAHMGHHDRVSRLPDGAVELACSAKCPNQVFRMAGKPIYGTQFHAEMSAQRLVERLDFYRDSYMPSDEEFESLRGNPLPTPEADTILHRFLEMIV